VGLRGIGVIVPVHDEQHTLAACLSAIDRSVACLRRAEREPLPVRVIVVLDACRDGSAAVVDRHPSAEALVCTEARVGAARAVGVAHLLASSEAAPDQLWLANTDADSTVPSDWLVAMVRAARSGADLVLGTVVPEPSPASAAWAAANPARDGHPYVHGANLGVRASAYLELGGFAPVRTGEDVGLAARAVLARLPIARIATIPVRTSARTTGRAPAGFADYLAGLAPAAGS
jgi:glycosyltransferase involved in cell wall biosynthesis